MSDDEPFDRIGRINVGCDALKVERQVGTVGPFSMGRADGWDQAGAERALASSLGAKLVDERRGKAKRLPGPTVVVNAYDAQWEPSP